MANRNQWIADRRLYLDKDGKVVEANDPARAQLLVAAGDTLPMEQAERLGLTGEKARPAPENKLKTGPDENKMAGQEAAFGERPEGVEPGIQEDGQGLPPAAEPEIAFDPAPALEAAVNEEEQPRRKGRKPE